MTAIGDQVRVGKGKTLWTVMELWSTPDTANGGGALILGRMARLFRADAPHVQTSAELERLRPAIVEHEHEPVPASGEYACKLCGLTLTGKDAGK